ncbi:MAG: hypothetical protein AAGN35_23310 [Bacteroidota bacterium]
MKPLCAALLIVLALVYGCDQNKTNLEEVVAESTAEIGDPNFLCPGCNNTLKCTLDCPTGGFQIKVHETPYGAIKYSFHPRNTIYVDYAYHQANYPFSPTCNPYTFDSFILLNTVNHPSSPWKDVNGNVIMGNVYQYRLKNPQCLAYFTTAWLHGVPSPCSMNSALSRLNIAQSRPASGCGNPSIICPPPPPTSVPYLPNKPPEVPPSVNIHYSYECINTNNGVCLLPHFPMEEEIQSPGIGPVSYEYLQEDNAIKFSLWRDPGVEMLTIAPSATTLDASMIYTYQLPEGTKLVAGEYPIVESEYGFGYSVIPLEN